MTREWYVNIYKDGNKLCSIPEQAIVPDNLHCLWELDCAALPGYTILWAFKYVEDKDTNHDTR